MEVLQSQCYSVIDQNLTKIPVVFGENGVKFRMNPEYLEVWDIEKTLDYNTLLQWHRQNWQVALWTSAIYLLTVFTIRGVMKKRKPFRVRNALFLWNTGLAVFSITGFLRSAPELKYVLGKTDGIYNTICRSEARNSATLFWGFLFVWSKVVELGDSLFIVLRKQPLIFLHYYHHVTVLSYTWYTVYALNSSSVWFGFMNYGIHSLMYSYYALKALQVRILKSIAMTITLLQLGQMGAGIGINIFILYAKGIGQVCVTETSHVYYALLMYTTYFILFANYFHGAYLNPKIFEFKKSI